MPFLYISASANGVKKLREECLSYPRWGTLKLHIAQAIKDNDYFSERWADITAKDYKALLIYILKGNYLQKVLQC